jgi:TonB family protein
MKVAMILGSMVFAVLAVSGRGVAQQGTPVMTSGKHLEIDGFEMYTQNEPFQLIQHKTATRVWPDGIERTSETVEYVFRDSQARFRLESGSMKDGMFRPRLITLVDPVALTEIHFAPNGTAARLVHLAPRELPSESDRREAGEQPARSAAYYRNHPQDFSDESLGSRVIAGEQAEGRRTKRLVNAVDGSARMSIVTDTWRSPELKIALLTTMDRSSVDVTTTEVTWLQRGEPDSELFKTPARLTLDDQMGFDPVAVVRPDPPQGVLRLGPGIVPPQVLHAAEPEFSDYARRNKIGGNVLVYLQVDPKGRPTQIHVIRGVGHGLDEKAMDAVGKYRFKPATKDGQPVTVEMEIMVDFQVFTGP